MTKTYSANDRLRNFAQNLDFTPYIFDDVINIGPEIKLRERSKDGEVDAILLHKNIICLVGINKGKGSDVHKEIEKFFDKLDKIEKVENLKLELEITAKHGKKIDEKAKNANEMLKQIQDHINKISKSYNIILLKIFFCPDKEIETDVIRGERSKAKIIIDKDLFEYFEEVLNRLSKEYFFKDFMHFLNIKKIDLAKKSASKSRKPGRSSPFKVTRLELEKEKIIMYSLSLRVEEILDYVTVLRMAQKYSKKGFQRMIKSNRLDKINREYLDKNETFPNNVIIALDPELYKKESNFYDSNDEEITFFDEYNSLIVIDGQHRLFSFVKGNKLDRHILITLIFFKGEDKDEKYLLMDRMFYKINKTQERIDPNLSFILKARIDPESDEYFWHEVFMRLNRKGFFANRFSFKESTLRKNETRKSIISVITYGGALKLNKTYKKKGLVALGLDVFYGKDKNENINFAFNLLKNYFDAIELALYKQNVNKNNLTPREIGALIRLLRHFIMTDRNNVETLAKNEDITKSQQNENKNAVKYFETVLGCIPFKKTIALDLPPSNWAAVEGYMLKKIHNRKPEFGNKGLLSKKGLDVYKKGR